MIPALAGSKTGASMENGRRHLSWTLDAVGKIHGNAFIFAWVTVREHRPMDPSALRVSAQRTLKRGGSRVAFTDRGRDLLEADLLAALEEAGGFDARWLAVHAANVGTPTSARRADDERLQALRDAAWWEARAALDRLHNIGLTELRALSAAQDYDFFRPRESTPRQQVLRYYGQRQTEAVVAGVYRLGTAEHRGWLTASGDLIPDDSILQAPAP